MMAMCPEDAAFQAEKLAAFVQAGGDEAQWWATKGWSAADAAMIRAARVDLDLGRTALGRVLARVRRKRMEVAACQQ